MNRLFFPAVLILSLFCFRSVSAADDLQLEGVSYERSNPFESIAVVNGEFLKEGSSFRNYQISKITPDSVKMVDQKTGQESELRLNEKIQPKTSQPAPADVPPASVSQEQASDAPSSAKSIETNKEKPPAGWTFNPFGMIQMAQEVALVAAMKKIHMSALAYHYQHEEMSMDGKGPPTLTLQKLIEADVISDIYGREYKGYKFDVHAQYDDVEVTADPVHPDPKLKHYLIDRHGVLRFETGKPATSKSPPKEI